MGTEWDLVDTKNKRRYDLGKGSWGDRYETREAANAFPDAPTEATARAMIDEMMLAEATRGAYSLLEYVEARDAAWKPVVARLEAVRNALVERHREAERELHQAVARHKQRAEAAEAEVANLRAAVSDLTAARDQDALRAGMDAFYAEDVAMVDVGDEEDS